MKKVLLLLLFTGSLLYGELWKIPDFEADLFSKQGNKLRKIELSIMFDGDNVRASDYKLLDALKLVTLTANIGDNRTLALHMQSTIYSDFSDEARRFNGVTDGLIRVSIGLEDPETIAEDFLQAAESV